MPGGDANGQRFRLWRLTLIAQSAEPADTNSHGNSVNSYEGGTSVATPLAAGFATALMEQRSWLRGRPALLRAYLMANAVRVDSDGILVGDRDGYGRLDYGIAQFGKAYWWDGSNGSFFTQDTDGDGRKEIVVVYNLTSTGTYHAVISWLVDGSYAEQTLRPNMDLDLSVRAPNGTSLGHSVSAVQNHEGVRFTTSSTGNHTFVIERYFNSGQGDVSLGLVIRKR